MRTRLRTSAKLRWIVELALVLLLLVVGISVAQDVPTGDVAPAEMVIGEEVLAVAQVITYQGRLLTPATGASKPDATYPMTFRLYSVSSGGSALWTETQNIPVARGLFTALLGSVTPFGANVFNGQNLWLGVTVGTDPELTPRTRITAVAYALYANRAETADTATTANTAANATNALNAQSANNANTLDNMDSTEFVSVAGLLTTIAGADGSGSMIDADYLDGLNSTDFARNLGYQQAADWVNQCVNVGQTTSYYHYQVASADDIRLWKLRPLSDDTQFSIVNFSFRRHFGNYAYHFQVTNTGTGVAGSGVNGCYDVMFYRLQ